jgi:hypothetical protein
VLFIFRLISWAVFLQWFFYTESLGLNVCKFERATYGPVCPALQVIPDNTPDFERIIGLIRAMRANDLLRNAGPTLEIVFGERETTCTNRAGYAMMRNFFEKHPVSNFKTLHKGGGSPAYLLGIYKDQSGQTFKVSVFFGQNAGRYEITRLIFR